ncbi:outer membrane lipoprotein LolB [Thiogranum longum]|uniref:Outer-membrane lipoprotein LolB n=1 Tax=Thiogranum longum TaxID=1537524 RepID=A0A4R1HB92_9GAMM|nr:lipoprotein insertase outer membrane protein LolB [Thiogranum longum]TCK19217.1 outer membrane lipoprotein LolB [Thiogranum longum]
MGGSLISLKWLHLFRLYPLLLLSACATQAPLHQPADSGSWEAHKASVAALRDWQVRGRLAVRTDEEGWSAAFDWKQDDDNYRIRLRGPFGQGAIELEGGDTGVWLKRAGRPAEFSTRPEILLEQQSGWRLPVAGLDYWLRGLPDREGDARTRLDAAGRLASLQQHGWQIEYRDYRDYGGYALPARLDLQRDGVHVKLLVDEWEL